MRIIPACDDKLRERATQLYFAADKTKRGYLGKVQAALEAEGFDCPAATLRSWKARYWQDGRVPPAPSRELTERVLLSDVTGPTPEGKAIQLDQLSLSIIVAADRIARNTLSQVDSLIVTSAADVLTLATSIQTLASASQVIAKAANEARAAAAKTINGDSSGQIMPPERSSLGALAAYDN